jgi:ribose transport system substrate-binding protein
MMFKKKTGALVFCAALLLGSLAGCGGSSSSDGQGSASGNKKIILITMDSTDQHWVGVDKGAKKAVKEIGGITYKWMAPDKKDDSQQIERVNNAVADGADAIIIAANGPDAISNALKDAQSQGIKIVYVDSPAKVSAVATFATDNEKAGGIAAQEMIDELKKEGKNSGSIGIVNFNASAETANKREAGFREAFEGTQYKILETQYSDGDAAKSKDIADNYISDGAVGVFGVNEGCTVGTGNAIKAAGGGVVGVGFDQSDAIRSLVKDGSLLATMAQNPELMGYDGVKAAVDSLEGKTIKKTNVDTGVKVLKKDDIE